MYEYKFDLDRVVDGDTIDGTIDLGFDIFVFKRVRLYGINAPESRTKDLVEKAAGLISKEWLEERLANMDIVVKTQKDSTGKYGRVLGDVYVNDVNINNEMLELELAKVYK